MRGRVFSILVLLLCIFGVVAMIGPVRPRSNNKIAQPVPRISPEYFRCILVGDSQTTEPSANRIRTQDHQWDAPIVGELICVGSSTVGFVVNNSNGGIGNLAYSNISLNNGWPNGGPGDFFAPLGSHWECSGDILAPGSRVGRFRLRFGSGNFNAPWDEPWGIGNRLVAKIAIRTSPMCVDAIETRPERGGLSSFSNRIVHKLNKSWGVQIIEQPIPVDIDPLGDDVGVGLFFPSGSVEQAGQVLQVLGVVIERVDSYGRSLNGTVVGYQGRGGWNIQSHLDKISFASRVALVEMINPDYIMIMLGHNQESGGIESVSVKMELLVKKWETVFLNMGRARPGFIYVTPWTILSENVSPYLLEVESVMQLLAAQNRRDVHINYLPRFDYLRPDIFDPARYQLDSSRVHPGDIPTAINLTNDLFQMIFHPNMNPAE